MARKSSDADNAHAASDADLAGLLDAALGGDGGQANSEQANGGQGDVMLSATAETIALLNSIFASDLPGLEAFSGWNFVTFG